MLIYIHAFIGNDTDCESVKSSVMKPPWINNCFCMTCFGFYKRISHVLMDDANVS